VQPIQIPKLTASDDSGVLRERVIGDGARVSADDVIAILETSKAAYASADGVLCHAVQVGSICPVRFEGGIPVRRGRVNCRAI
jgi:pyruvate/2-oxoglutarate dehydrogenase complex dihydrolipoamide acyltransferase (E2) component